MIKKLPIIFFIKNHAKPMFVGLVFACLFSVVFYVVAVNTNYLPIKFPAAIPFLVADEVSNEAFDSTLLDDEVIDNTPVDQVELDSIFANYPNRLVLLDNTIKGAGIPIDGVALLDKETYEIRIDFKLEATEEQKVRAKEIADAFDWVITYRDIFDAKKVKEQMMERYSADRLVTFAPYLSTMQYFLDHKEFKKLKSFMNSLFVQNIVDQKDYMVLSDILSEQKIYFNLKFASRNEPDPPQDNPSRPPAEEALDISEPVTVPDSPPALEPEIAPEPESAPEPEPTPEPVSEPESEPVIEITLVSEPEPEPVAESVQDTPAEN